MEIIIDNFDYWNMPAMKYFSFPKKMSAAEKKEKAKYMCTNGEYYGSTKVDGAWNMLIKDMNGNFHLRSRTESVNGGYTDKNEWIPQITSEFSYLPNGTVLLGEIYLPNNEGSRKITSILNCLLDKCIERQKKSPLHYYVFDVLAYDSKSLINTPFLERISKYLLEIKNSTYIQRAEYKTGNELWELYGEVLASGREGIVITRGDYKYDPGKRTAWKTLKLKKELQDTIDAYLTGKWRAPSIERKGDKTPLELWNYWVNVRTGEKYTKNMFKEYVAGVPLQPTTKYYANGWAAAVEFAVKKNGKEYSIGYISGIPDTLREEIVNNPEKWTGKVAELNAMEIQDVNNDGHYTMRHGIIVNWRDDKTPDDCDFSQIIQ